MVDKTVLRAAQLRMLDILIEIDRICEKHNINYFIMYGTLLGAVRHKGFIPWDDDCDICMMRDDYEKFIEYAKDDLSSNFFIQTKVTDKNYKHDFLKVRDLNSKIIEFDENENENYKQGLFVDIFVFDYHFLGKKMYDFINIGKRLKEYKKQYEKKSFKRKLIGIIVFFIYQLHWIFKTILILMSRLWRNNTKLVYVDLEMIVLKQFDYIGYDKNKIFPLKKTYEFEGHCFYGPNDSDYVLKKTYGDYMTLPKPEDRQWHAKKIEL